MKKLCSLFFILLAVMTLASSRPSQAAIGAIVAAPAIVTGGLVIAGTGAGVALYGVVTFKPTGHALDPVLILLGGVIAAVGLVILEGEQAVSFAPLSAKQASELGISAAERMSFNTEIDQVNALASHVDSEVAQMEGATDDDAASIWTEVKDAVAPETFAAMVKVASQLVKK